MSYLGWKIFEGVLTFSAAWFWFILLMFPWSAFYGLMFMLAWNFSIANVFGLPELNFLQAWILLFTINLIRSKPSMTVVRK